jgi:hypothetical protein
MARSDLVPLILMILTIEISEMVFLGLNTPTTLILQMFLPGQGGIAESGFMAWLTGNIALVGGIVGLGAIAIGTVFGGSNRLDFVIYGGLALTFISYIKVFGDLYNQLNSLINSFTSAGINATTPQAPLFAILIIIPLIVLYIFTILKFWRGSD